MKRREAIGISVRAAAVCAHCVTERTQDIRDLVLHLAADAPPPSWVRVEVRLQLVSEDYFPEYMSRTLAQYKRLLQSWSPVSRRICSLCPRYPHPRRQIRTYRSKYHCLAKMVHLQGCPLSRRHSATRVLRMPPAIKRGCIRCSARFSKRRSLERRRSVEYLSASNVRRSLLIRLRTFIESRLQQNAHRRRLRCGICLRRNR